MTPQFNERWYLGVSCKNCGKPFAIAECLSNKKFSAGGEGPLLAECPHCHNSDEYAPDEVVRYWEDQSP